MLVDVLPQDRTTFHHTATSLDIVYAYLVDPLAWLPTELCIRSL